MKFFNLIVIFLWLTSAVFSQTVWQKHPSPTSDILHNAVFVSDKNGWVISHHTGLILQTKDGGESWQVQTRLGKGYLESVYFVDKNNGWICGENGRIVKTSDGGKNWRLVGNFDKSNAFSIVHFFDKNHGLIFGTNTETRQGLIFETNDGGKNWLNRSAEVSDKTGFTDAVFRFTNDSLIVGGKFFIRSVKGENDFEITENKHGGIIRGLFFINKKIGWAVGHRGLILRTSDGGKSWENIEAFSDSILRSVYFTDEKNGFIVGNRNEKGVSMWQTKDSGATWQTFKTDFPNLHRIVSSPKKLWLFGADGAIYSINKRKYEQVFKT